MEKRKIISKLTALLLPFMGGLQAAQADWPPSAADVLQEAQMRAEAEKARNDDIVGQQRQQELQRQQEEERLRRLEEAEKRAKTG